MRSKEERFWEKVDENKVRKIRKLHSTGKYTSKALGEMYGVHPSTIRYAVTRRNWGWVK